MLEQNVDSSSVNSNFTKIPKPSAKQGDVSAAFGAQEFGQDDPPHYLCKAVANLNQNLAAISPHNLTIFAALCRTISLFKQVRHRTICHFWPHLNVAPGV